VGSSPKTSSPTGAAIMAWSMGSEGFVKVSERNSMGDADGFMVVVKLQLHLKPITPLAVLY